ncbi:unnamed protein product, partial [Mesorhabditis spiculigera]
MAATCSLAERIHERYFDENEFVSEFILDASPRKKLLPRGLEMIVLNHMQIRDVGDTERLDEYMRSVRDLDLAWNDINEWEELSKLFSRLPVLSNLNLSFNPLNKMVDVTPPKMERLSTLILNGTNLPVSSIQAIVSACPSLRELHLSHNEFNIDDPSTSEQPVSETVTTIHLNHCGLRDWEHVMRLLSLFPNKRTVYLSENPITRIHTGSSHLDPATHCTLTAITLSKTEIDDWESIDHLEHFPSLQEVRLTCTPVLEKFSDEERVHMITARLEKLKVLNGSIITDEQRETSERFFIRYFQDRDDKPPHYQRLLEKHGNIEKLVKVDLTPQLKVRLKLVCEETNFKCDVTAPVNRSIAEFFRFLETQTGIQAGRMRVFHCRGENILSTTEIRPSKQAFHTTHAEDGDTFMVQSKPIVSRKRAGAPKSESSDH